MSEQVKRPAYSYRERQTEAKVEDPRYRETESVREAREKATEIDQDPDAVRREADAHNRLVGEVLVRETLEGDRLAS